MAKPKIISFIACKAGAMDTALLACAYTDSLSARSIANRIWLSIFKSDKRNKKVNLCNFGNILDLSRHIVKKWHSKLSVISLLLKLNAEHLLCFHFLRLIVRVHLNDKIITSSLSLKNFKCIIGVWRSNNTVADLFNKEFCNACVTFIAQSGKIAKWGNSVTASCTNISLRNRRKF